MHSLLFVNVDISALTCSGVLLTVCLSHFVHHALTHQVSNDTFAGQQATLDRFHSHVNALQIVLREFLNPRGWKPSEDSKFFLDAEQINQLCDVAEQIFQAEPSVLRLRGTHLLPTWAARVAALVLPSINMFLHVAVQI